MNSRRTFLKQTSLLTVGAILAPHFACKTQITDKNIGLQLWTVRDDLKKDLMGTLKQLSEIGYKWLELADYNDRKFYGKEPKEFRTIIEDLGMKVIASHTNAITIDENFDDIIKVANDHAEVGAEYVVKPWLAPEKRESADSLKQVADDLNTIGKVMNEEGLKFGYHNHNFEFEIVDDQIPYDILLMNTDPAIVIFEIDIFWVKKGGGDSIDYFKKYPGRFELFHVKDMDNTEEAKNIEVGSGIIDFEEIFSYKELAGMKYFFIEQDDCPGHLPLESVKISFDYLNKVDYALT